MKMKQKPCQNSKITGWTIKEWQEIATKILINTYPNFSEGRALVQFSESRSSIYGHFSDMVEGFTRTFILVGFWLKNRKNGEITLQNGDKVDWVEIYRKGILHATDPKHKEYWG